jgi:hypothetical protein
VGVRAVLEKEDALGTTELGDRLDVERDVSSDVDHEYCAGPMLGDLSLEIRERQAKVLAVAVHEFDLPAGVDHGERRRHERVRRTEHGLALDARVRERGERAPGPTRKRDRRETVPATPARLESRRQISFGPPVRIENGVPELVQTRAIAMVESDGEAVDAHGDALQNLIMVRRPEAHPLAPNLKKS